MEEAGSHRRRPRDDDREEEDEGDESKRGFMKDGKPALSASSSKAELASSSSKAWSSLQQQQQPSALPSRTLLVLNVATALSGFLFGYDTGVVSGAVEQIQGTLGLSTLSLSYAVSATPLTAAVFSLAAAPMNVARGRKPTLLIAAALYVMGALVVGLAGDFWSLLLGRACLGIAVGCGSMTVPIFIGEVAPPANRGRMVTLYDMMIVVGQLVAGGVNGVAQYAGRGSWRVSTGLAALPALAQFAMLIRLPESPRWLVSKDRTADAKNALRALRGDGGSSFGEEADLDAELRAVREIVDHERTLKEREGLNTLNAAAPQNAAGGLGVIRFAPKDPWVSTIRTLPRRRALSVGVGIMTFQAFTGINAVMYYGSTIARGIGLSRHTAVWTAAVFDLSQLLGVVCSIARMDAFGRRPIAMQSTAGTIAALVLMVLFAGVGPKVGVLLATMIYLFVFGAGLSGVAWTLNSEVHPLVTRSHAQSIAVASNWGANAIVSVFFASVQENSGAAVAFLPFLVATTIAFAWMYFFLPETKGVSLEDLERRFEQPLSASAASRWGQQQHIKAPSQKRLFSSVANDDDDRDDDHRHREEEEEEQRPRVDEETTAQEGERKKKENLVVETAALKEIELV